MFSRMKYFNYDVEEKDTYVTVKGVTTFDLKHIFECGQAFRWQNKDNGRYLLIAMNRIIELEKKGQDLIIYNSNLEDFNDIWARYFDLETDYDNLKKTLANEPIMSKAVEFGKGIRILKQDFWEMLVSFIISANNRIPMIMKTIENMCRTFGKPIYYNQKEYYAFPTVEELANADVEQIRACSAGYRSEYISETAQNINKNGLDPDFFAKLKTDQAVKEMKKLKGVGDKVASCALLFSGIKKDVFPIDVWIERIMRCLYFEEKEVKNKEIKQFANEHFGELCGIAQQYLFYYARENKIG